MSLERVEVDLRGAEGFSGAVFRYGLVDRVARACAHQGVSFLAFGFGPGQLRLVLEGSDDRLREVLRGVKVGTARSASARWGVTLGRGHHLRSADADLCAAVTWAHLAPGCGDPLASPWSSHRDLLGFRRAVFFDAAPLRARVDPGTVHARCGGSPLPGGPAAGRAAPAEVSTLLRISAAVLGVLPADRRCFRMFAHLARERGVGTADTAAALALTARRVRQLRADPEPMLGLALVSAGHVALSRVP